MKECDKTFKARTPGVYIRYSQVFRKGIWTLRCRIDDWNTGATHGVTQMVTETEIACCRFDVARHTRRRMMRTLKGEK